MFDEFYGTFTGNNAKDIEIACPITICIISMEAVTHLDV